MPGAPAPSTGSPVSTEVVTDLDARHRLEVEQLLADARAATGHEPLSGGKRLELTAGPRPGFAGVLARDPRGRLVGYGHLSAGNGAYGLEVVVEAGGAEGSGEAAGAAAEAGSADRGGVEVAVIGAAVDTVAARGGARVLLWMSDPPPSRVALAAATGFSPSRDLLQMRVGLPVAASGLAVPDGLRLRAFRPGEDEAAWLVLNNRAFAGHPEQGGWRLQDLTTREAAPWFDAEGFLVAETAPAGHEERAAMVGACWTKLHTDSDPPLGEIYVISVDPQYHGRGLGKVLTVAGLDWMHHQGIAIGMLYVDRSNLPAVQLYRALGFTVHHVDRAFSRDVAAA